MAPEEEGAAWSFLQRRPVPDLPQSGSGSDGGNRPGLPGWSVHPFLLLVVDGRGYLSLVSGGLPKVIIGFKELICSLFYPEAVPVIWRMPCSQACENRKVNRPG